jgi:hypothetical protein
MRRGHVLGLGRPLRLVAIGMLVGCGVRERLTAPGTGPVGVGPTTVIDRPTVDTTVAAGPDYVVTGFSKDPDGVDTLYFRTEGGVTSFQPYTGGGDSVRFGLPLTTIRQSGQIITVRVFATDGQGNRGDTAIRRVTVQ